MYKPIIEDDRKKICALMRLYKIYYRFIGLAIAVIGVAILPAIPYLVKSDFPPELNIYVLYLLNLGATVLTYWLFAYKNALLQAHQRNDVASKITLVTLTIQYGLQLLVLIYLKDYYIYCMIVLAAQVVNNIITAIVVDRIYPNYRAEGTLEKNDIQDINNRIKALFTAKLGGVIVNSVDSIVISAFLGLTTLAIYQNYYFILTSIIGIVAIVFSSCTAGIGNSIIVETKEKNYCDLRTFTFIISWIAAFCGTCLLCLFQPFMRLWVGETGMLELSAVVCFVIYYYVYEINALLNLYKDAAGIWYEDRFRPLITAAANLTMNLLSVQYWGVYGVILSTVISTLFVGMPWLLNNLFTLLFYKKDMRAYVKQVLIYLFVAIISASITYFVCTRFVVNDLLALLLRLCICLLLPNIIFFATFRRTKEFAEAIAIFDKMTKGKLKLTKLRN